MLGTFLGRNLVDLASKSLVLVLVLLVFFAKLALHLVVQVGKLDDLVRVISHVVSQLVVL